MKVGIVTFHRAHNCGAALQCVALQTVLEKLGHEAVVVDCNDVGDGLRKHLFFPRSWPRFKYLARLVLDRLKIARWRYVWFRRRFMRLSRPCLGRLQDVVCDCYVLGSDQVLNPQFMETYRDVFLMTCLPPDSRRVAYAASFGVDSLPEVDHEEFRMALERFAAVGIREDTGVAICRRELGLTMPVCQVLDPTLLLDADEYRRFETPVRIKGPYVLIYYLGWMPDMSLSIARRVARQLGARVVVTSLVTFCPPEFKGETWLCGSPGQFLHLVRNASCVVTTSFHGAAFAIVNRRPLISILPQRLAVKGRLTSLLKQLDMECCIFHEGDSISDDFVETVLRVDYEGVEARLRPLREASIDFMRKAVES